ncbi:hypothetical protein [Solitalea lacus]|uniref:hypothetical protein n=1 Tax=Solitalea lacus TaxID=2911172 RepID=UPI001EDB0632|nr:hypothetical protein [Solitalea lacus]UKJ08570.1 hypothetical protein L2B55_05245 [Solitalea lacus]
MKKVTIESFLGRVSLLIIFIIGSAQISFAQKNKDKNKEVPAWIRMMDEPGVNYKQAVAEFERFWEGRTTPIEENELFESAGDEERERELRKREKRLSKRDPAIIYAGEYKRFKNWQFMEADFVKPDGTLKTMDERLGEWEKEKELRKAYEFKPRQKEKETGKDRQSDPQKNGKEVPKDQQTDTQKKEKVRKDQQSDPHKPANSKNKK